MTPNSPITGVSTQGTKCLGKTPTPSPPDFLGSPSAIPSTMKTPCSKQQDTPCTLLLSAQRKQPHSCSSLPGIKKMTTNPYASLCRKYPHICKFLGTIPSDQLQYAKVPFWYNIQIPLSKHSWGLQIIATWNTKGRVCLNAHNKDWLKELAKEISEATRELQNIHNHPYQQP